MSKTILLVEDDRTLLGEVARLLAAHGYAVADGKNGDATDGEYDLALLDVKLPGRSGYEVCSAIRSRRADVPVVFLTSSESTESELTGFAMGGDDFIRKPFEPAVLLARIARLLRKQEEPKLTRAGLTIDPVRMEAVYSGNAVQLTRTEYVMLATLASGKVTSRNELINELWDNEAFVDENTLYVNMNRLRDKLRSIGMENAITTVRGAGYRLG